jgi:hypothetical protein
LYELKKNPRKMWIDHDEERRGTVGVRVAQHPAPVHVTHDVFGGIERHARVGGIVHRQDHAGDDLEHQADACQDAEVPEIVQVARHRITGADGVVDEARQRQLLVQPLHEGWLGL